MSRGANAFSRPYALQCAKTPNITPPSPSHQLCTYGSELARYIELSHTGVLRVVCIKHRWSISVTFAGKWSPDPRQYGGSPAYDVHRPPGCETTKEDEIQDEASMNGCLSRQFISSLAHMLCSAVYIFVLSTAYEIHRLFAPFKYFKNVRIIKL